jgi:Capsule polysaccharide biosynthesis protein
MSQETLIRANFRSVEEELSSYFKAARPGVQSRPPPDRDPMNQFKILTVGTYPILVRHVWDRIAAAGGYDFAHLMHPTYEMGSWPYGPRPGDQLLYFFEAACVPTQEADTDLLASLEGNDTPTIHNMILGDCVVSKLPYSDALGYATFLARRLEDVYRKVKPMVIIGDFDSVHGSMGYAVAKRLNIPWFALQFSPLPSGHVALCSNMSPGSVVTLEPGRHERLRGFAAKLLADFELRRVCASAYIPPNLLSPGFILKHIPSQVAAFTRTLQRRRNRALLRFTEVSGWHSIRGRVREGVRVRRNLLLLRHRRLIQEPPPDERFAFFGLHMQPEASVDVWAPFFSNQIRAVELLSRSIPPTHKLLVKLHKSDVTNYSPEYLSELANLPGVEVVSPYADTHQFILRADIVFSIQGTMGLEAALLGKPVIMFGNILGSVFPSATVVGKAADLPSLVRAQLARPTPSRPDVIEAFARFLEPFYPASSNDWTQIPDETAIEGFRLLFNLIRERLQDFTIRQHQVPDVR